MTREIPVLGHAELALIGKVQNQCLKVDLSRVSGAQFDTLMKTLMIRGREDLSGIGLNLDLYNKTKEDGQVLEKSNRETRTSKTRSARGSFTLAHSAVTHRKNLSSDIASMLSKTLCYSESLSFLAFRSIDFNANDFRSLSDSISPSSSLRTLHLCNVPLGDGAFGDLCRALKKSSVFELRCRMCRLTDACAESLRSLISHHVSLQGEVHWQNSLARSAGCPIVCLQCLDLRDNFLTSKTICAIGDALLDLPLKLFDLRGNLEISASVVVNLAREMADTTIRTGPSKRIKQSKVTRKPYKSKIGERANGAETKMAAGSEAKGNEVIELEPGLSVVGPRARELVEYLAQLDRILQKGKLGVPSFFAPENPRTRKVPTKTFKRRRSSARRADRE
jgi:hypothetical protein